MMTQPQSQHALVIGLGQTGLSCVRHLMARGQMVTVVDTRKQPPGLEVLRSEFPQVPVHLGEFQVAVFERADLLIVSPGLSLQEPVIAHAIAQGKQVVGDIELFAQQAKSPVIAITGSNGKSTVTTLVGKMCESAGLDVAVGGNIGVPALSLLRDPEPQVYVLELSSFQLETTHSLNAHAAAVLNVSADHLDRYKDMGVYAAAKQRIFRGNGVVVVNGDDPQVMAMAPAQRDVVRFSLGEPENEGDYGLRRIKDQWWLTKGKRGLFQTGSVRIPGRHNLANALAAMALAETVGVMPPSMRQALESFVGLPHRTEVVAEQNDIVWINDSKGTNVGATQAALNGMEQPVVLIAGGEGKGQDFTPLKDVVKRHAHAVVLIGRDAGQIEAALQGVVPVQIVESMQAAVKRAGELVRPGDAVLLSPACASFDMFDDYMHRGDVFREAVRSYLVAGG